jgi:hypothetical protein
MLTLIPVLALVFLGHPWWALFALVCWVFSD